MRPLTAVLVAALLFCLSGVAIAAKLQARIDGSSIEAFRSSWDHLNNGLSPPEQQQLQIAVIRIALAQYRSATEVPKDLSTIRPEMIRSKIDGMTYTEIIALVNKSSVTAERLPPCDPHRPDRGHPCVK